MEKAEIIGKRIECIIGIILLVPVFLGVIAFIFNLLGSDGDFATMRHLSIKWTCDWFGDVDNGMAAAMSSAPIYLGLMAIAGVWLVKDSFKYFFMNFK